MKKHRVLWTLLFVLCLTLALPAMASAYKNQWVRSSDGKLYYYGSNGKKYVGGPKSIKKGSKTYRYLFDSKGRLYRNKLTYVRSKRKYCYSQADGKLVTSFKKIGANTYYGDNSGYLKTGLQKYNRKYYYFDKKTGRSVKKTWKKVGSKWYYFNSAGRAYHSAIYTVNGYKYYFNSKAQRTSGVHKFKDGYYGFSKSTGRMLTGWQKFGKDRYYFSKSNGGKALAGGLRTVTTGSKKTTHYFNNLGVCQTGWLVQGNRKYYLDPKNKGAQVFGRKTINGVTYNFGTKGYITYRPTGRYVIKVNREENVVTIYNGNVPVKAMTCSVGMGGLSATPTGTFYIQTHLRWHMLNGPSYGQYCSHFLSEYLFHSVPMYGTRKDPYNVRASDYNKLGQAASGGCIRLSVADAKWIYDNIPIGTTVVISDHEATPLGKPATRKMTPGTIGKDPTDIWS